MGDGKGLRVEAHVILTGELRHGIGATGIGEIGLGVDGAFRHAIDGGGRGEDDLPDAGVAGSLEHVEGASDVDRLGEVWLLHGFRDADEGGEVVDVVGVLDEHADEGGVLDGALDEFTVDVAEVLAAAGAKGVENGHAGAAAGPLAGEMTTDEAGTAGNEDVGHVECFSNEGG